jgi:hypothetical protein
MISWRATRSSSVSLSSCEAELYAATMAAQELRWLTMLLNELHCPQAHPVLWCDNQSAIALTKDPVFHARTKHIELRYFFIRDLVSQNKLLVKYVSSNNNAADIFTKPLGTPAHLPAVDALGLSAPGSSGGVSN